MGINRNIVECKEAFTKWLSDNGYVLIETLWNVKLFQLPHRSYQCFVLIETLWNVKDHA